MNKKLLFSLLGLFIGLLISLTANADLDKAIAYAKAGETRKAVTIESAIDKSHIIN